MVGVWHVVRLYALSSVLRDLGSLLYLRYLLTLLRHCLLPLLRLLSTRKNQSAHHYGRRDHAIAASRLFAELDVAIRNLRLSRSGC